MRWWFALVLALPGCLPDFGARMQALTPRPPLPTLCAHCKAHRPDVTAEAEAETKPGVPPSVAAASPPVTFLGEKLQGLDVGTLPKESTIRSLLAYQVSYVLSDPPEYPEVWVRVAAASAELAVEVAKPSLQALALPFAHYLGSLEPGAALDPVETWAFVESVRATELSQLRPRAVERALHAAENKLEGWCKTRVSERLPHVFTGNKDATALVERVFTRELTVGLRLHLRNTMPPALVDDVTTRARARVLAATRKVKPKVAASTD